MNLRPFYIALRRTWLLAAIGSLLSSSIARADDPPTFERDVRPILKAYCLDCHGGGEELAGGLDLRLKRLALAGGDSGPAIVPGDAAASRLVARMKTGEMPPTDKKVPADKIATIERWLALGATTLRPEPERLPAGIDITQDDRDFWAFQPLVAREPPRCDGADSAGDDRVAPGSAARIRTSIDAFVSQKLHERGLHFAPDADRSTLLRRAALDLTGLPPTADEIAAFEADPRPDAYELALDRLLASPRYGERWARHWLDVAGYADSDGNGSDDTPRPYAYKYRDYVIRAFNADKPLDQFIIEQLAGDELLPQPWKELSPAQIDLLAATGFLRMAPDGTASGGGDEGLGANQTVADTLKIVGGSLLGLTVGCAQCHDHRYDPIPQSDYYRLRAIFEPALDPSHWRRPGQRLVSLFTDADRAKSSAIEAAAQQLDAALIDKSARYVAAAIEKQIEKLPETVREAVRAAVKTPPNDRTPDQKALLDSHPSVNISRGVLYQYDEAADKELKADEAAIAAKRAEKPIEDYVAITDELSGVLPPTHIFYRGDHRQVRQEVAPGDLTIAAPDGERLEIPSKDPRLSSSGRRLTWARHLTNGRHPLLGRVLANRIWLHHFGRGIVETPGDFGQLGTRPTHPELLDWLALELPRNGWSMKAIHKLIMTSTVYRQSSAPPIVAGEINPRSIDGATAYYWRYPLRRLEAEAIRDAMLMAAGRLDASMYGSSVPVERDFVGQIVPKGDSPRRGIYLEARRTAPVSFLTTFDAPAMSIQCERRTSSAGAPQSLMLMNGDFVVAQAGRVAERVIHETEALGAADPIPTALSEFVASQASTLTVAQAKRIAHAWRTVYGRAIERDAFELAGRFMVEQVAQLRALVEASEIEKQALTNFCQQLLSSNEFLYVE